MAIPCAECGADTEPGESCPKCGARSIGFWSIPIRDPEPLARPPRDWQRTVAWLGLGLAALVVLGLIAVQVLGGQGGDGVATGDDVTPTTVATVVAPPTTATTSTTSVVPGDPDPEPPGTTVPAPAPAPPPTVPAAPPATSTPPPGGDIAWVEGFGGGWVAQLSSLPVEEGEVRLEDAWLTVRRQVPGAVVAVSAEWEPLAPGYWVIVDAGPFADAGAVEQFCAAVGDRESCLPRSISPRP